MTIHSGFHLQVKRASLRVVHYHRKILGLIPRKGSDFKALSAALRRLTATAYYPVKAFLGVGTSSLLFQPYVVSFTYDR